MAGTRVLDAYKRRLARFGPAGRYAFATGRLAAHMDRLIPYARLRDLLEARDSERRNEIFREALDQAAYPQAGSLEARVEAGRDATDRLLKEICPKSLLPQALLLEEDVHNLKVLLRDWRRRTFVEGGAAAPSAPAETGLPDGLRPMLFMESFVSPEKLWRALCADAVHGSAAAGGRPLGADAAHLTGEKGARDLLLAMAARETEAWAKDPSPVASDLRMDRLRFEALGALAEAARAEEADLAAYLAMYREWTADLVNAIAALRLLRLGAEAAVAADVFVPGGRVSEKAAAAAYRVGKSAVQAAWRETGAEALIRASKRYLQGGGADLLTKASDEALLAFAALGKASGTGPAQVAAYWLARRLETQNLRIILTVYDSGIGGSEPERLLRDSYRGGRACEKH